MPDQDSQNPTETQLNSPETDPDEEEEQKDTLSTSSDSDDDSDKSSEYEGAEADSGRNEVVDEALKDLRFGEDIPEDENSPEVNVKLFNQVLQGKRVRRRQDEEERDYVFYEDLFDFPEDPEKWREEDLKELWADAPLDMDKPGWDPVWADEDDWDVVREEIKAGRDPPIAPFYVPYRKPYPVIPEDHHDISTPKAVIEELDRIEEFLRWVSYIFPDGSSYEGTVWDDLAHGKGVYVAEQGLVRYEGEWLQNNMEGHGVVEVDLPDIEPIPGSKLEEEMRAEGHIISRDYMTPEDKEWLEMDIQDSIELAGGRAEIPFYEKDEWIRQFGRKPEKGRYRYAGQWKHARMHGCGVYEINERTIYGRFYFGELMEDDHGCDEDRSALHAGIAEVAAAKARMFVNKPDGMVREERGPYSDPQHPYFYEEDDVWMAPGFINQFYEVPDYWKTYVHEVDEEREMWLNSFYKAPLRIPMPAELEYWWSKEETPEFVLINKEPEPDPEDPSKLVYTEDPVILHTRTGRIINYIEDEEHGVRLFWQPPLKEGEDVDPEKVQFLPLGFDEFYGENIGEKKQNMWMRLVSAVENKCKPVLDKLDKWSEEKRKASEMKMKLIEKELELIEAELCLEELIEDMDEELKIREKEEEKNVEMGLQDEVDTPSLANQDHKLIEKDDNEDEEEEKNVEMGLQDEVDTPSLANQDHKLIEKDDNEDEEEEEEEGEEEVEDEDDAAPSSFGSVITDQDSTKNGQKSNKPGQFPFSTSSLGFASSSLVSGVPSSLQQSFLAWKTRRGISKTATSSCIEASGCILKTIYSISFPPVGGPKVNLKVTRQRHLNFPSKISLNRRLSQLRPSSQLSSHHSSTTNTRISPPGGSRLRNNCWLHAAPERESDSILSLHSPWYHVEPNEETIRVESRPLLS